MSFTTYTQQPAFSATDQFGAGTIRTQIGGFWVDYIGTIPTLAQVQAQAAPTALQILTDERTQLKALIAAPNRETRVLDVFATLLWSKLPGMKTVWPTLAALKADVESQVDLT